MGLLLGAGHDYKQMIWHSSMGGNYVAKFGVAPCFVNMGILGILATKYVFLADILVEGHINGCIYASILTACGFAASGLTVRMYLPTLGGVFVGAFVTGGIGGLILEQGFLLSGLTNVGTLNMLLAAIFSCGMAPIVGEHGLWAGITVGIVHAIIMPSTGAFHGWMSLYNNALSLSIVATFMYPIFSRMGKKTGAL